MPAPSPRPLVVLLSAPALALLLACAGCGGNGIETAGTPRSTTSATATPSSPSASPSKRPDPTRSAGASTRASVTPSPRSSPDTPPPSSDPSLVVHQYAAGESYGLVIDTEADAARLVDPPAGLGAYALQRRSASAPTELTVAATRSDGWASGGVTDIYQGRPAGGGYQAIWHDTGAGWQEQLTTQDEFGCSDLRGLGVPAYPVGPQKCFDGRGTSAYRP